MGGSEEPMELFKRFRGREPQIDAQAIMWAFKLRLVIPYISDYIA